MSFETCFQQLPIIETERLILRQITDSPQDGADALEFINDYNVYRYWGLYDENKDEDGKNKPRKIRKLDYQYKNTIREFKAKRELTWVLELKENNKVIGEMVLYDFHMKHQADIGYRINSQYWGKCFAPEAGQAMMKVAFECMDLKRLQLRCFAHNQGSIRVAEKLGFHREGLIRHGVIISVITDYYIYGLLQEEYMKNPLSDEKVKITC